MINRLWLRLYYLVFRLLARWRPPAPGDLSHRRFRRILVFSAAGIGDTLTDSVAIRALKESFPEARVTVVTHRRRIALALHNPFADEVVPYHKSLIRFLSLAWELGKRRPDLIVMLRGNDPDLWPLAYLVHRHVVVSCPVMTRFKFLISHPVVIPHWDATHGVEQTLEIVRYAGARARDPRLVYEVREDERQGIRDRLREWEIGMKGRVIFQVGGGRRSAWRDWPLEHFAELGRKLLEEYDIQLILLGGKDLSGKAAQLHAMLPPDVVNLTGKLSLVESAALLSESKILVSTDTGIMHLGFAVGINTVALIHCNNPASRVGPYGYEEKHRVAQLVPPKGMPVSKRVNMSLLTPDQVWLLLNELCAREGLLRKSKPSPCR